MGDENKEIHSLILCELKEINIKVDSRFEALNKKFDDKFDKFDNRFFKGNGQPPIIPAMSTKIDRNSTKLKTIYWSISVLYVAVITGVVTLLIQSFG